MFRFRFQVPGFRVRLPGQDAAVRLGYNFRFQVSGYPLTCSRCCRASAMLSPGMIPLRHEWQYSMGGTAGMRDAGNEAGAYPPPHDAPAVQMVVGSVRDAWGTRVASECTYSRPPKRRQPPIPHRTVSCHINTHSLCASSPEPHTIPHLCLTTNSDNTLGSPPMG